jgi:O-antigen/teichoic acid export membrane protein
MLDRGNCLEVTDPEAEPSIPLPRAGVTGLRAVLESTIRKLTANSTVRGTLTLAGCTTLGAVIMVAVAPVLTHLFTPAVFGIVALYTSIVSIGAPIGSLRYDLAILLPEDDNDAANVLALSVLLLLPICAFLGVLTWFWSRQIAAWLNAGQLAPYLWLAPVGILGAGMYQALSSWALRKEEYGKIARTRLSQNGGMAVTQVGLGALLSGDPVAMLIGDLVSRYGGVTMLLRYAWPWLKGRTISFRLMRATAKRYAKFPFYSTPASLLTAVEIQIPTILLSRYFGPSIVGWYALTYRVLRAPTTVLGQAAAQSLFANAARVSRDPERMQQLTKRATIVLMAVGLPIFALVVQEGPELFARAFGAGWMKAGLYARILAPALFISFIANPLSNLLNIREWQGTTLLYSALECVITVGCLMIGVAYHSDVIALCALGVGSCLLSIATINRFFKAGFTDTSQIAKAAAPLLLPLLLCSFLAVTRLGGGGTLPLVLRLLAFTVVYLFSLWKLQRAWNA